MEHQRNFPDLLRTIGIPGSTPWVPETAPEEDGGQVPSDPEGRRPCGKGPTAAEVFAGLRQQGVLIIGYYDPGAGEFVDIGVGE